jgi:ribose-phosphate pyrophosphokinase
VPITAKLVANLITTAGADRVLAMDLHAAQLQGFFDIPVDHLFAEPVLSKYFQSKKIEKLTIVSPDVGNMKRASRYVQHLNGDLAIIHKKRVSSRDVQCSEIIGNVKGRNVLMCDDMISTAGTMCSAAKLVKEQGANKIFIGATHAIFCDDAIKNIADSQIDEIVVTDTIALKEEVKNLKNLKVLSVSEILGEAIKRIHRNESISSMFH